MDMAFGEAGEGRAWAGRRSDLRPADFPVCEGMIRSYCALVEDANPRYWEHGESPPGMISVWSFPPPWSPGVRPRRYLFALEVPLPGRHVVNVSYDCEYRRPIRAGERLLIADEVLAVSDEKVTRLGRGHFITTRTTFHVEDEVVAIWTNVLYRYDTEEVER
jgi:uncharacterized protein